MKKFLKSLKGKLCIAAAGLVVLGVAGFFVGRMLWLDAQPKFHDVTIELGQELPPVADFLTEYADPAVSCLVTADPALTAAGQLPLVFSHDGVEETVTLTIVDTTAPQVQFQEVITAIDRQPAPEEFVAQITDLSATTVSFAKPLEVPQTYGQTQVEVVVTDASGNTTKALCNLRYMWMYETVTLELGQPLLKSHLLLNPEKDGDLIDQALLDEINASPVGTYTITSTSMEQTWTCTVTLVDTTVPTLELKQAHIDIGDGIGLSTFVKTAEDASGEVSLKLIGEPNIGKVGTYTVQVEATDINGNTVTKETTLEVHLDTRGPAFSGLGDMKVEKRSEPDYLAGVKAVDSRDGEVSFTCDSSKVDLTKAGTYYITYTAQDSLGNKTSARRKITVNHSAEDTQALVQKHAAKIDGGPEKLRTYVRNLLMYNSNWGGDDPVWYGFSTNSGNCYVHAMCLKALYDVKGISSQLIWTTCKTHYWLIVQIDGKWRHIDPTPGNQHGKYSIMTDAQRKETLSGRDWDRTLWPACE